MCLLHYLTLDLGSEYNSYCSIRLLVLFCKFYTLYDSDIDTVCVSSAHTDFLIFLILIYKNLDFLVFLMIDKKLNLSFFDSYSRLSRW